MTIRHGEEFEIKFTDLIEDRYEKVIERLYNGNVTNYFCVVKDGDVMVINLYGTTNGRAKEIAGDLASMFAYKIDADIVLSIFTHKNNASQSFYLLRLLTDIADILRYCLYTVLIPPQSVPSRIYPLLPISGHLCGDLWL